MVLNAMHMRLAPSALCVSHGAVIDILFEHIIFLKWSFAIGAMRTRWSQLRTINIWLSVRFSSQMVSNILFILFSFHNWLFNWQPIYMRMVSECVEAKENIYSQSAD